MDLDQQIQLLVDHAPQDGQTPQLVEAIAPVLKTIAGRLRHSQYYVLQTLEQAWIVTTLNNRSQPGLEKNVVYAFPTLQDLASGPYSLKDPQVFAMPTPVTHIIFQLISSPSIDSLIFFETSGNVEIGTEIRREEVAELIQFQLKQTFVTPGSNLPSDIA